MQHQRLLVLSYTIYINITHINSYIVNRHVFCYCYSALCWLFIYWMCCDNIYISIWMLRKGCFPFLIVVIRLSFYGNSCNALALQHANNAMWVLMVCVCVCVVCMMWRGGGRERALGLIFLLRWEQTSFTFADVMAVTTMPIDFRCWRASVLDFYTSIIIIIIDIIDGILVLYYGTLCWT